MADACRIRFKVNGIEYSVGKEITSDLSLVDYIRDVLELRGTKYMCREGGCGACIVSVVKTSGAVPVAVNACLVSVTSCQGWDITTVEKVGNRLDGYHDIQKALTKYNGTQCGYCTPGWVMAMYSILQGKTELTELEIEKSFGSNICRCTGYRPILEAFKTLIADSDKMPDIEDLDICSKTGKNCNKKGHCDDNDWCVLFKEDGNKISIQLKDGKYWFMVFTISDIFQVLEEAGNPDDYMLVAGNTAKGAYPIDEYPKYIIEICQVQELKGSLMDQNLVVGAGNTLTEILNIFQNHVNDEYFGYLQKLIDHLQLVAHIPVRNLGTMAGNLMTKHRHNDFPSDVFLLLETVGAQLTIVNNKGLTDTFTMQDFLKTYMKFKVIKNALFPPLNDEYRIVTFKIMPRAQNAHAIVNAGFRYKLQKDNTVVDSRLVFGGLSPSFVRASETEKYLTGKVLFTNENLQGALKVLNDDLVVEEMPPEPSVEYRKKLALGLFYKGLLILYPDTLGSKYQSGTIKLHETRPVSSGRQEYDTNALLWPLNQPMPKLESMIQCSGEAKYTEDLPSTPMDVFAAFVLTTVATGEIDSIDESKALNEPGVLAFYSVKDIPGKNSFSPPTTELLLYDEEILCGGTVKYFNQPLGIIVAESRPLAERAAKMVEVTYKNVKEPVIDIKGAKQDPSRQKQYAFHIATDIGLDVKKKIKGSNYINGQYHMSMETLVCVTYPLEEGFEVHSASQWLDGTQLVIARALNLDANKVDVYVRRLGGAFGVKITKSIQVAVASCLVAKNLNRPCRFIQSITTNLRAVGKRYPAGTDYEVSVNDSGEIQHMDYKLYEDNGYTTDVILGLLAIDTWYNCYKKARWNYNGINILTDMAKNTFCRAPGNLEAVAMVEMIMEHISYALSLDPIDVRLANLDNLLHHDIKEMVETLKTNSDYAKRREAVDKFNKENRWKKRGLRTSFSRWSALGPQRFDVNLSVYRHDGTVVITHGGVEMGQGVNTLAAQVCAHLLNIDVSKIQIKGNNSIISPNTFLTGYSTTGSNVCIGIQRCCEELIKRLAPIKLALINPTWEKLIETAHDLDVDLQTHGHVGFLDLQIYNIYGVACAEVEIDVLTGESEILRVDLLQDVGRSINPDIDVGQVEGAFVMGIGYWLHEHLVYSKSGENLTDRTWNYHVPLARDIPQDFRVYLKKKSYSNPKLFGAKGNLLLRYGFLDAALRFATGEPPICLAVVAPFAIREATVSARFDSGIAKTEWFPIDGPCTTESICMNAKTKIEDFKYT